MSQQAITKPAIIPCLRYRDAAAMVEWLCQAFGFEKHLVVPGENGRIAHAQLTFAAGGPGREGMIMLGSGGGGDYEKQLRYPDEAGGVTQAPYIVIDDVDAHHDRAKSAGAEIVMAPQDQDYGGRIYICRDPEGHIWSFGNYDPWAD